MLCVDDSPITEVVIDSETRQFSCKCIVPDQNTFDVVTITGAAGDEVTTLEGRLYDEEEEYQDFKLTNIQINQNSISSKSDASFELDGKILDFEIQLSKVEVSSEDTDQVQFKLELNTVDSDKIESLLCMRGTFNAVSGVFEGAHGTTSEAKKGRLELLATSTRSVDAKAVT